MVSFHKEASSVSDEPHNPPEESDGQGDDPAANGKSAELGAGADEAGSDEASSDAGAQEDEQASGQQVSGKQAQASEPAAAEAQNLGEDGRGIPAAAPDRPDPTGERNWYILKVQSNREDSIKDALQRRIAIEGLQDFFGDIIVPIEMVSEFKAGKKRTVKRKLYPGYIVVHMEINDDTWHMVRGTPGIGDFVGSAGKPTPMLPKEVEKIIQKQEEQESDQPPAVIQFRQGDRVKVTGGNFENFEGEIGGVDPAKGRVTVIIQIFNRATPVDLEYWQVESV